MKTCFLCNQNFDETDVKKHGEHIIQNAIGGKLVSDDILCESCGGKLNNSIDAKFTTAVNCLVVTLNTVRDRGENSPATVTITPTIQPKNDVNLFYFLKQDFSVKPSRPIYFIDETKKEIQIVAPTKEKAEQFAKSLEIREKAQQGFAVICNSDLSEYIKEVLINIEPESITILRGILKIAIEFAMHNSIDRSYIAHLLEKEDLTNNEKLLQSCVIQYYPTTNQEKIYETLKLNHENNYPTHQLYLFNIKNDLYCYVEIFGTLQKYVHLTNKYYDEDLVKKYIQRATIYNNDETIFMAHSLQDLQILARENGIDISKYKGLDWWEKCQLDISNAARKRQYELDPDEQIEMVATLMERALEIEAIKLAGEYQKVADFIPIKTMQNQLSEAERNLNYSLYREASDTSCTELSELQQICAIYNLCRKNYADFRISANQQSCPKKSLQVASDQKLKYFNYKCLELLAFSQKDREIQLNILISN